MNKTFGLILAALLLAGIGSVASLGAGAASSGRARAGVSDAAVPDTVPPSANNIWG